jgi:hypothetical protein
MGQLCYAVLLVQLHFLEERILNFLPVSKVYIGEHFLKRRLFRESLDIDL